MGFTWPLRNLVAFFDNSAGAGKAPDAVPEIPEEYLHSEGQTVGFTGGRSVRIHGSSWVLDPIIRWINPKPCFAPPKKNMPGFRIEFLLAAEGV